MTYLLCLAIGALSGFSAGLLGIGGGLIIVPALMFSLPLFGVTGPEMMKIAVATSMAVIIPSALVSSQAHAAKGGVDAAALARLAPGVIAGAAAGALAAAVVSVTALTWLFIAFLLYTAWRMLRLPAAKTGPETQLPGTLNLVLKGFGVGGLSALLGIGGGTIAVPLLSNYIAIARAVGTASALGLLLSLAGAAGYLMANQPPGCGEGCVGYVFMPAVGLIGLGAVLTAPYGAWLAHALPVAALKRIFALTLVLVAGNMVYKALPRDTLAALEIRQMASWLPARLDAGAPDMQRPGATHQPCAPTAADGDDLCRRTADGPDREIELLK